MNSVFLIMSNLYIVLFPSAGHRTYVEYPNPSQAVNNMNKELDLSKLTVLEKKIGEGMA